MRVSFISSNRMHIKILGNEKWKPFKNMISNKQHLNSTKENERKKQKPQYVYFFASKLLLVRARADHNKCIEKAERTDSEWGKDICFFPRILVKIIESLMGIKLALKTLKYEMLLLFDDGVVVIVVVVATTTTAAAVTISSDFCVCYQCSCCEKRIVFVKTIGKCN